MGSNARKKQVGFYAEKDVEEFLDNLDSGVKTKTINQLLRKELFLRKLGVIQFNCYFCANAVSGRPVFFTEDVIYCGKSGEYIGDDHFYLVLVECPNHGCRRTTLLKMREDPETESLYDAERVYPDPEQIEGAPDRVQMAIDKAESAYFRKDFNAVALHCHRVIDSLVRDSSYESNDFEHWLFKMFQSSPDDYAKDWIRTIATDTRKVLTDSSAELLQSEAFCLLCFTKELVRSRYWLEEQKHKRKPSDCE